MVGERRLEHVVHGAQVVLVGHPVARAADLPERHPAIGPASDAGYRGPPRASPSGTSATRSAPARTRTRPASDAGARRRRTPRCRSAARPDLGRTRPGGPGRRPTRPSVGAGPADPLGQAALDHVDAAASGRLPGRARSPRRGSGRSRRGPRRSDGCAAPARTTSTSTSSPARPRPAPPLRARGRAAGRSAGRRPGPSAPSGVVDRPNRRPGRSARRGRPAPRDQARTSSPRTTRALDGR